MQVYSEQIAFDFNKPETTDDKSAHDCFWNIHQYMEKCDCPISWTDWEEKTGRRIWDIA